MSPIEFKALLKGRRFTAPVIQALYLTLVEELRKSDAAAQAGISRSALSHALNRFQPRARCGLCGQPLKG